MSDEEIYNLVLSTFVDANKEYVVEQERMRVSIAQTILTMAGLVFATVSLVLL